MVKILPVYGEHQNYSNITPQRIPAKLSLYVQIRYTCTNQYSTKSTSTFSVFLHRPSLSLENIID